MTEYNPADVAASIGYFAWRLYLSELPALSETDAATSLTIFTARLTERAMRQLDARWSDWTYEILVELGYSIHGHASLMSAITPEQAASFVERAQQDCQNWRRLEHGE